MEIYPIVHVGCWMNSMTIFQSLKEGAMKETKAILSISLLFFIVMSAAAVAAPDWIEYSSDDEGNIYYYRKGTVDKSKGKHIVQFTDRKVYSSVGRKKHIQEMTQNGFPTAGYDKLIDMKVTAEFDCKKAMTRALTVHMVDSRGKVLYSMQYDKPEWTYMPPDSPWGTLRKEICK